MATAPPGAAAPSPPGAASPPPPADTDARRFALPRSTKWWLALLLLTFALPPLLGFRRAGARRDESLSAAAFEKYVLAESEVRRAFGMESLGSVVPGGPESGNQQGSGYLAGLSQALDPREQRDKALRSAVNQYRALLRNDISPNLVRRVFILEHALGRPLDATLLENKLAAALRRGGKQPAAIEAERALWRDLYGRRRVAPAAAPGYAQRLRAMRLRFLESRALADLYLAAGQKDRARLFEERLRADAQQYLRGGTRAGILFLLGFAAGTIFLILFVISVADKRWQRVRRVATRPQRLGWGDLLDAFLFYLLLAKGVGLAAGLAASRLVSAAQATPRLELALQSAVYIGTGFAALAYLAARARQRGVTLADIGLTTRGRLWANIAYGVAGYCATLPLMLGLRALAQYLFRHLPNTAPNPIMPLIVGERDVLWRVVIFVLVAVAAPFFEELFFRGALFAGLRSRWGWPVSAVISSVLFAVVHPPQDWLPIFGLGFGFAAMREMRQSLVPSMTAHLIQNSVTFFSLSTLFRNG